MKQFKPKNLVIILSLLTLCAIVLGLIWSLIFTRKSLMELKSASWDQAASTANFARPPIAIINHFTMRKIAFLRVWQTSLELLSTTSDLSTSVQQLTASLAEGNNPNFIPIFEYFGSIKNKIHQVNTDYHQSSLLKKIAKPILRIDPEPILTQRPKFFETVDFFSQGRHRWVIIFQNDGEIRASGGFMGSYALVTLNEGELTEVIVEDIYDADGQFSGYVPAPEGVDEYLSENRGLRLPDSNWDADFTKASQTILNFFAMSGRKDLEGIIALNLSAVRSWLNVIGPVDFPDFKSTVSSNNIDEILSGHRENFFPGSTQKKQMLSSLITKTQLKFAGLSNEQYLALAKQTEKELRAKNILFFSNNEKIQNIFLDFGFSGAVGKKPDETNVDQPVFYLLESNVGINKSNELVSRSVNLSFSQNKLLVEVEFNNAANPNSKQGYVNYQRLIIPKDWQISAITYNNQVISSWDENTITNAWGSEFKQIGFIISLSEQQKASLSIDIETHWQNFNTILIQKQPGLAPIAYRVKNGNVLVDFLLENDQVVNLIE